MGNVPIVNKQDALLTLYSLGMKQERLGTRLSQRLTSLRQWDRLLSLRRTIFKFNWSIDEIQKSANWSRISAFDKNY